MKTPYCLLRLSLFFLLFVGFLIAATAGSALAVTFTPVIDEFWITKNLIPDINTPNEIFRDSFGDGLLPPSGPDGTNTYVLYGGGGMTSEAGGKLTITPSLGAPTIVTTTFADMASDATRQLATNPANPNFLGFGDSFAIHGLYDMSNLPAIPGQSFGIRAIDRTPALGNAGNDTYYLFVGNSNITGDITVFLRHINFEQPDNPAENAILWSESIESLLTSADQIELVLSKAANSDQIIASYWLYNINDGILRSGSFGPDTTHTMYVGEDYIRGGFASTDRVPVPEPSVLVLLGAGLAGLRLLRRKLIT